MIDGKFDVVFRGQIVRSFDLDTVKSNLVGLFKSSPEAIERLFSGAETPIRKGLDYTQAMKYQSALKSAGALALIKEVEAEEPQATPTPPQTSSFPVVNETVKTQVTEDAPQNQAGDEKDLSLAAAGSQILPPKVYEKRDVDTSELSMAAAGERLLPSKPPEEDASPDLSHLSITDDTSPIGGEK